MSWSLFLFQKGARKMVTRAVGVDQVSIVILKVWALSGVHTANVKFDAIRPGGILVVYLIANS